MRRAVRRSSSLKELKELVGQLEEDVADPVSDQRRAADPDPQPGFSLVAAFFVFLAILVLWSVWPLNSPLSESADLHPVVAPAQSSCK